MLLDHKHRWVYGPMGQDKRPIAAEYATMHEWHVQLNGYALCYCRMNAHQYLAASKDPRLTILGSLYANDKIPDHVADAHKTWGVKRGMKQTEMLEALGAQVHHAFLPEQ